MDTKNNTHDWVETWNPYERLHLHFKSVKSLPFFVNEPGQRHIHNFFQPRPSLSENIAFSFTLTLFSEYSVSFTLSHNKPEADIMGMRLASFNKPNISEHN